MRLTATYSPDDNKLRLYASARLDKELYDRVHGAGFSWAPRQELFVAPKWTPAREDLLIELCGEIGDEDTSLTERAEQRAERFEDYSDKRQRDADSAHAGVARIADGIPMGQPILVGHHSERHARKDKERIENGMRKAVKMWETSKYWTSRAAGAIQHAKYKEIPAVRARRIKGLEAEERAEQRTKATALKNADLWSALANPDSDISSAIKKKDGTPTTFLERAVFIAERTNTTSYGTHGRLTAGTVTAEEVASDVMAGTARQVAHADRWLAHIGNRLAYERAMLAESGWTPPPKPKTKSDLPLLNYSGDVAYRNPFVRGEITRTQAIPMTKAELAAIDTDSKGTRMSECGTHRVRIACSRRAGNLLISAIYLTDSKQHPRPSTGEVEDAKAAAEVKMQGALREQLREQLAKPPRVKKEKSETDQKFEALRETAKTGVVTVVAPQLFPTPKDLALQMVDLADLRDGECVLEPSAGTGAIVEAVLGAVDTEVLAYEIDRGLCSILERKFPGHKLQVRQRDFLDVTDFQGCYPKILMNPPFTHGSDIKHILHARGFLAPGGRLVAICADGPKQRETLKPIAQEWVELPEGSFKDSGTNVRTAMLMIQG